MEGLIEEHEAAVGGTPSAASSAEVLRKAGRNPMALPPAALSQLAKSALSLEVGCWQLTDRICAALRASRWRQKAAAALKDGKKYSGASQCPVPVSKLRIHYEGALTSELLSTKREHHILLFDRRCCIQIIISFAT